MIEFKCKICGNEKDNRKFQIEEMMIGLGESFQYMECSICGCLQLVEIPKEMEKYYPNKNYYSFEIPATNSLKEFFINKRDDYCITKKGLIGKIVNLKNPNIFFSILGDLNININSKILDVGCGGGNFLYTLKNLNFKHLVGIDPYLEKEVHDGPINLLKKDIKKMTNDEKFDIILFSHSFEHMENPFETMQKAVNILSENGKCLVRMPVKTNYIWNLYGINWVQIDAPRHFFVHTLKSFEILLEKTGFKLIKVIFDSTDFQFWGSEQNKKGIPLNAKNSYVNNKNDSIFKSEQIMEFRKDSKKLNATKSGDQAIFIIEKEINF